MGVETKDKTLQALKAAKIISEEIGENLKNNKITRFKIQKILYFSHMIFLGRESELLLSEEFQIYPKGPVIENVHRKMKDMNGKTLKETFSDVVYSDDSFRERVVRDLAKDMKNYGYIRLYIASHRYKGAWRLAKKRSRDSYEQYPKINDREILQEYFYYLKS